MQFLSIPVGFVVDFDWFLVSSWWASEKEMRMLWLIFTLFIALYKMWNDQNWWEPTRNMLKLAGNPSGMLDFDWFLVGSTWVLISSWWVLVDSGYFMFYHLPIKKEKFMKGFRRNWKIFKNLRGQEIAPQIWNLSL